MSTTLAAARPPWTLLSEEEAPFRDAVIAQAEAEVRPRGAAMGRAGRRTGAVVGVDALSEPGSDDFGLATGAEIAKAVLR